MIRLNQAQTQSWFLYVAERMIKKAKDLEYCIITYHDHIILEFHSVHYTSRKICSMVDTTRLCNPSYPELRYDPVYLMVDLVDLHCKDYDYTNEHFMFYRDLVILWFGDWRLENNI